MGLIWEPIDICKLLFMPNKWNPLYTKFQEHKVDNGHFFKTNILWPSKILRWWESRRKQKQYSSFIKKTVLEIIYFLLLLFLLFCCILSERRNIKTLVLMPSNPLILQGSPSKHFTSVKVFKCIDNNPTILINNFVQENENVILTLLKIK